VAITAGSREVPGRKGCDNRHPNNNNNNNNNNNKSACPILAKEQYTKRHDRVCAYTSAYARKQGYNWTKNSGMNMCQNQ